MDIKNILPVSNRDDYQLDSFLSFLKAIKFEYNVPSIHIAGTNGKGSTANYLYNIYRENGYKVGLFSSPAFKDTNDMICCNGENITDEQIIAIVDQYRKEIEKYNLSLYELITFVALYFFNKSGLDLAVIECCMGGELDATNVFRKDEIKMFEDEFSELQADMVDICNEYSKGVADKISNLDENALKKNGVINEISMPSVLNIKGKISNIYKTPNPSVNETYKKTKSKKQNKKIDK